MAQKTAEAEAEAKDQHTQRDHIGDDEVTELQSPVSLYEKVREQAERFATTRLGQFVIERVDRGLKLIEDTTKWSLPHDKNSSDVVLERPLPWAPFLLLIILLRLVRIGLSVGALMIGNGPVAPTDMIYFIQTRRHKLRAIRVHGLRVMRHRQQEMSPGKSFTQKLSLWFNRAICRAGVQRENSGRAFNMHSSEEQVPSTPNSNNHELSMLEDEPNTDENLTIKEMLAKYANENSEDDSDFVGEEKGSDSSSSNISDSDSHTSEQMTSSEEQQLIENRDEILEQMSNKENPEKPITVNGSNGSSEQAEHVPAAQLRAPEVKTGSHLSAALMKTQMYNNVAAAANPESTTNSTPYNNSQPDTDPDPSTDNDNDNDNNTDCDTDSSSTITVCQQQHQQQPQLPQQIEEHNATTTTISDICNPNPDHPTVETLTPATSSEDIFYSPIGSPNNFNSSLGTQTLLKNAAINAAPSAAVHSTPISELDEVHSTGSETEEAARQSIYKADQQDTHPAGKPFKQQQQRQFNNSHQRFRGRNRR